MCPDMYSLEECRCRGYCLRSVPHCGNAYGNSITQGSEQQLDLLLQLLDWTVTFSVNDKGCCAATGCVARAGTRFLATSISSVTTTGASRWHGLPGIEKTVDAR